MEIKHITLFFCDIRNTFLGKNINQEGDIKSFVTNLECIRDKNNSNNLLFAFSSEETPEFIEKLENSFLPFISDYSIKLIRNTKDKKVKTIKIIQVIKKMSQMYFIDEIYFADDCEIYHELVKASLIHDNLDIKINSIMTTNGGMTELNMILKNVLEKSHDKNVI